MYSDIALKYLLAALDEVGIEVVDEQTRARAAALLPDLEKKLNEIVGFAWEAAQDPGPMHPAHDTWDDGIWFQKTLATHRMSQVIDDRTRTQELLDVPSIDSVATLCGQILHAIHDYIDLKLNLKTVKQRKQRSGSAHAGYTDVFLLWEARNQHQHCMDVKPRPKEPSIEAFQAMIRSEPVLFAWTGSSQVTDKEVEAFLPGRSLARESLMFLDLTTKQKILDVLPQL